MSKPLKSLFLAISIVSMVAAATGFFGGGGSNSGYSIGVSGPELIPNQVDCSTTSFVGTGTQAEPYEIESIEQLQCIGFLNSSRHYELVKDIDASETKEWDEGRGFKPIGLAYTDSNLKFDGSFNGNNNSINNLYIERNDSHRVGLFSLIEKGAVKNLHLEEVDIDGQSTVGAIAGEAEGSNISNIHISGEISGTYVGSLAGRATAIEELVGRDSDSYLRYEPVVKTRIKRVRSSATLIGDGAVGGIAYVNNGFISESVFEGRIKIKGNKGGAAGIAYIPGEIRNSYSNATIIPAQNFFYDETFTNRKYGGIIGKNGGKIVNSFTISEFKNENGSRMFGEEFRKASGPVAGAPEPCCAEEENVYWERTKESLSPNLVGDVKSLTPEEFKNKLTALDLGRKWITQKGNYPELKFFSDRENNTYQDLLEKKKKQKKEEKDRESQENISPKYPNPEVLEGTVAEGSNSNTEVPRIEDFIDTIRGYLWG